MKTDIAGAMRKSVRRFALFVFKELATSVDYGEGQTRDNPKNSHPFQRFPVIACATTPKER